VELELVVAGEAQYRAVPFGGVVIAERQAAVAALFGGGTFAVLALPDHGVFHMSSSMSSSMFLLTIIICLPYARVNARCEEHTERT
jgi:hypothetical protein